MKKSSLIFMTSAIISLPICGMELEKKQDESLTLKDLCTTNTKEKISPGKEECLKIMGQPGIMKYPEWECLFRCYGGDKEGFSYSEKCAKLVSNFIKTTSKENCTVGLQVAISTPNLPSPIKHPETRSELIKKLIA